MGFITKASSIPTTNDFSGFASLKGIIGGMASAGGLYPVLNNLGMTPGNAFVNAVSMSYMLTRYYITNLNEIKPAAVIAGIPLGTVTELSHAISDREVKYRANGGIFLAHQSGGNESCRIIGRTWGPNRFIFLNMLEFLFVYGSSKVSDALVGTTTDAFKGAQSVIREYPGDKQTNDAFKATLTTDPWKEVKEGNISDGYREQHMTFPVITKDRVYLSMYIETYTWRQRLDEEGRKMVEYTIFFRKYEPQTKLEFGIIETKRGKKTDDVEKIVVYKEQHLNANKTKLMQLFHAGMRSGLEILMTLYINWGDVFNESTYTDFGRQMQMNYFGIDSKTSGRIPGIIERRGFF